MNITLEDDHSGVEALDAFDGERNNRYHLRIFDLSPRYPDPATVLSVLASPFGELNRAPEFDELDAMLRDAATERDAVTRHEKYLAIEDYVADNALVIPIRVIRPAPTYRVHSWVHGFDPPKFAGSIFHKVWLDGTGPKRELPFAVDVSMVRIMVGKVDGRLATLVGARMCVLRRGGGGL